MYISYHRQRWAIPVLSVLFVALLLTGCAGGSPDSAIPDEGIGSTQDSGRAVATLLTKVEQHAQQGLWERAAALLERALRIEPRNAQLWYRLARVRLQQGRYGMAENLAEKSNALAGDNADLKRRNAELIDTARRSMPAG